MDIPHPKKANISARCCSRYYVSKFIYSPRLPLSAKSRQTSLAGKELLHGGLLDGPLLGDQLLQRPEQFIHIRQRLGDGLFGKLVMRVGT